MAVYIGKDEMGPVTLIAEGKATVDRLFTVVENGNAIAQCGIRYNVGILDDRAALPPAAQELLARVWPPEAVKAAQDKRDADAAEEQRKRDAESEAARAARAAAFDKARLEAFDTALKALTEQRDTAMSAGDQAARQAIDAQITDLTALRDQGLTIEGQNPAGLLAAMDKAAAAPPNG